MNQDNPEAYMETKFNIPSIRQGYTVEVGDTYCHWFLPEHPGEGDRTLLEIFDMCYNQFRWDEFIPAGTTVIDIGAHSGDTTIPIQLINRSVVLAVEPNPIIKVYLDHACKMNRHLGKFITAHEAVTTSNTEVEILDHFNSMCNGGVIDPSWTKELQERMRQMHGDKITVPGITLEELCNKYLTEEELNKLSFIKTDTEGHDISLLIAGANLLDKYRPVLFVEWFFAFTEKESAEMFGAIDQLGYKAYYPQTLKPALLSQRSEDLLLIHKSKISNYENLQA